VVKSEGERLIADFLFLQGVEYDYELPYCHDVADAEHSQYRPDFHYVTPDGELWHEHGALDAAGRPPKQFRG
jgi:DNA helicase-4